MIATSDFLTTSNTQNSFSFGAYSAPPDALAGLTGSKSKEEGRERERRGERKGTGGTAPPPSQISGSAPA